MKKTKIFIICAAAILSLNSCTREFDTYNNQYSGVTDTQLKADFLGLISPFQQMQRNLANQTHWVYQLQTNLNADMYSGFFSTATPFGGGRNNTTYYMMDGWNERIMMNQLEDVFQQIKVFNKVSQEFYPGIDFSQTRAILDILKVISTHKVSDAHEPVVYSKYFTPNANGITDFDSQQDAYKFFIQDLDKAIAALQKAPSIEDKTVVTKSDMVFGGDTAKWAKLANSLKLRLAMRMYYADKTNSKKYAEEALVSSAGLLDDNSQNALVSYGSASPLYDVIYSWNDCKSGAPLLAYLNGFKDPRITAYAAKATDAAVEGKYVGIRQGIDLKKNKSTYSDYSTPLALSATGDYFSGSNGKFKVMTAAEVWFLKAEAALRGFAGAGNAKTDYENGIKASFGEWGKTSDFADYIKDATSTEAPYIDPKNADNNILAGNSQLSTITIAWNDADSDERKLERIITQKWLALYPDGPEAWAEQRRTGYPKLFQNMINDSNGTISTTEMIRRIPIPNKYRNSTLNYAQAVQTLGGPDTGGTKLWWDKK